ncbi:MAG: exonuclease domain-containing protein [Halieaceae bacterium]|jgi:DNA polymerase-3 subunit epsilon|nr:exonuclease domain-containing protein [Halieaceae bacterium]
MWRLRLHRLVYARRVAGTALQRCWQRPLPATGTDWRQVSFLVVDAEMSALDVREGELLSVGWVAVERGGIVLDSARHYLIKAQNSVGQSATIHSLRDCELSDAESGDKVLAYFLEAAAGKVLVFHNAALDMAFLNRVSRASFKAPILLPAVDTLLQEEALLRRREQAIKPGDLRLHACRERYGLPPYQGHNALLDALATAELLLAMAAHRSGGKPFPLAQLL